MIGTECTREMKLSEEYSVEFFRRDSFRKKKK